MRTMFISLVLIWSLTQLASAQPPPLPTATKFRPEGCGTTYKCYAPMICINKDTTDEFVDANIVEEVGTRYTMDIASNCPALIRFHSYDSHSLFVSIESFQETTEINSIVFQQSNKDNLLKNKFSCEISTDNKMIGKFKDSERFSEEIVDGKKLKCSFKVTRIKRDANDADIFNHHGLDNYVFIAVTKDTGSFVSKATTASQISSPFVLKCDPNTFQLSETDNKEMIYAKVHYDIESKPPIYCKGLDNPRMEYIPKGSNKYEPVNSIECHVEVFKINNQIANSFNHDDSIDIRCVAEVKYSCTYELKQHAQLTDQLTLPKYTAPVFASKDSSRMECPPDQYLIFVDGRRPIKNPTFECTKYGTTQYWTVNDIPLTEEGPEVYCSKEVDCHIFWMMPESAIRDGYMSDQDFLPKCFDKTGTMKSDDKDQNEISNQRCNSETGKFMYTEKGEDKVMDANTKFICKYPVDTTASEKQDQKNKEVLTVAISVAAGVGGVILAVAIGGFCFYNAREEKKMKKQLVEQNNAENELWGTKSEQAKAKDLKKKMGNSSSHGSEETKDNLKAKAKWNDTTTAAQTAFLDAISPFIIMPNKDFSNLEGKTYTTYSKHIPSTIKQRLHPQDAVFLTLKEKYYNDEWMESAFKACSKEMKRVRSRKSKEKKKE